MRAFQIKLALIIVATLSLGSVYFSKAENLTLFEGGLVFSMFVAVFAACAFILRSTLGGEITLRDGNFIYSGNSQVLQSLTETKTTECRLVLGLTGKFFEFLLFLVPGLLFLVMRTLYRKSVPQRIRDKAQNFFPPLWINIIILMYTALLFWIGYILVAHGNMSIWGAVESVALGALAFVAIAIAEMAILMFIYKATTKQRARIVKVVQSTAWYARLKLAKHAVCKDVIRGEVST